MLPQQSVHDLALVSLLSASVLVCSATFGNAFPGYLAGALALATSMGVVTAVTNSTFFAEHTHALVGPFAQAWAENVSLRVAVLGAGMSCMYANFGMRVVVTALIASRPINSVLVRMSVSRAVADTPGGGGGGSSTTLHMSPLPATAGSAASAAASRVTRRLFHHSAPLNDVALHMANTNANALDAFSREARNGRRRRERMSMSQSEAQRQSPVHAGAAAVGTTSSGGRRGRRAAVVIPSQPYDSRCFRYASGKYRHHSNTQYVHPPSNPHSTIPMPMTMSKEAEALVQISGGGVTRYGISPVGATAPARVEQQQEEEEVEDVAMGGTGADGEGEGGADMDIAQMEAVEGYSTVVGPDTAATGDGVARKKKRDRASSDTAPRSSPRKRATRDDAEEEEEEEEEEEGVMDTSSPRASRRGGVGGSAGRADSGPRDSALSDTAAGTPSPSRRERRGQKRSAASRDHGDVEGQQAEASSSSSSSQALVRVGVTADGMSWDNSLTYADKPEVAAAVKRLSSEVLTGNATKRGRMLSTLLMRSTANGRAGGRRQRSYDTHGDDDGDGHPSERTSKVIGRGISGRRCT